MLVQPLSYLDNEGSFLSCPPSYLSSGWVGGKVDSHPEVVALSGHSYTILDILRVSGSCSILIRSFVLISACELLTDVTVVFLVAIISIFC